MIRRKAILFLAVLLVSSMMVPTGAQSDAPPNATVQGNVVLVSPLQYEAWRAQIVADKVQVRTSWAQVWASWAQAGIGLLTLIVLTWTVWTSLRLKGTDILIECNRRYDLLIDLRQKLLNQNPPIDYDTQVYYERYWELQYTQFRHWQEGMIEQTLYEAWMDLRRREHRDNPEKIGTMTRQAGWDRVKGLKLHPCEFIKFVDYVLKHGGKSALAEYRRKRKQWRRISIERCEETP